MFCLKGSDIFSAPPERSKYNWVLLCAAERSEAQTVTNIQQPKLEDPIETVPFSWLLRRVNVQGQSSMWAGQSSMSKTRKQVKVQSSKFNVGRSKFNVPQVNVQFKSIRSSIQCHPVGSSNFSRYSRFISIFVTAPTVLRVLMKVCNRPNDFASFNGQNSISLS